MGTAGWQQFLVNVTAEHIYTATPPLKRIQQWTFSGL